MYVEIYEETVILLMR